MFAWHSRRVVAINDLLAGGAVEQDAVGVADGATDFVFAKLDHAHVWVQCLCIADCLVDLLFVSQDEHSLVPLSSFLR